VARLIKAFLVGSGLLLAFSLVYCIQQRMWIEAAAMAFGILIVADQIYRHA